MPKVGESGNLLKAASLKKIGIHTGFRTKEFAEQSQELVKTPFFFHMFVSLLGSRCNLGCSR